MKSKAYLTCSRSVVKKRNNNIDNKGPFNDPRSIALRGFAFLLLDSQPNNYQYYQLFTIFS